MFCVNDNSSDFFSGTRLKYETQVCMHLENGSNSPENLVNNMYYISVTSQSVTDKSEVVVFCSIPDKMKSTLLQILVGSMNEHFCLDIILFIFLYINVLNCY